MYRDLILKYKSFDLESALADIQQWEETLDESLEDSVTYNVLESIKDIIFDNCVFE